MTTSFTRRGFVGLGAAAGMAAVLAGCSSGSGSAASASASASAASASAASASAESAAASGAAPAATGAGLRFVTGGDSGTYYALGQVIAAHCTNNTPVAVDALTSEGSKANVESLEDMMAELGFCQSDVMAYAYTGTNIFEGMPVTSFSTVASLYDEQVQIVTCDETIKSVADLKGKRVSIGAANSGVYFNALDILGAYDLTEADITASLEDFKNSADSLKDGKIDAAFVVAGAPTTAITELSSSKQAYLISIDKEHITKLLSASDYYVEATIPAGTYTGIDEDVTTVAVSAVIIAADTVSENDIYTFTADIFDNLTDLVTAHDKAKEISLEKAASVTSVPYHPGAAKYFTEKGLTVTSK